MSVMLLIYGCYIVCLDSDVSTRDHTGHVRSNMNTCQTRAKFI